MERLFECGKLMVIVETHPTNSLDHVSVEGSVMYMSGEIIYSFQGNHTPVSFTLDQVAHNVLCHLAKDNEWFLSLAAVVTDSTGELRFMMTAY